MEARRRAKGRARLRATFCASRWGEFLRKSLGRVPAQVVRATSCGVVGATFCGVGWSEFPTNIFRDECCGHSSGDTAAPSDRDPAAPSCLGPLFYRERATPTPRKLLRAIRDCGRRGRRNAESSLARMTRYELRADRTPLRND